MEYLKTCFLLVSLFVSSIMNSMNKETIFDAIKSKNMVQVKKLIENDYSLINITDNRKMTPLHYAVQEADLPIVLYLLQKNADINIKDNRGKTPVRLALEEQDDVGHQLGSTMMFTGLVPIGLEVMEHYGKLVDLLQDWPLYKQCRKRQLLAFISTQNYLESPTNILSQPIYQYITEFLRAEWLESTAEQIHEIAVLQQKYIDSKNQIKGFCKY